VLAAIPKDNNANEVVIFQHGITANRTAMLGIAEALTKQGLTVIAIDLPLHGVTDTSNGLYVSGLERTFDVDLVDNDGSDGPDGKIDPSGEHFINLASLRTSRDNLRQAAVDLFAVTRAIRVAVGAGGSAPDLDGDGDDDLSNNISFVGHSLGGIVGVPYAQQEANLDAAVFGMAGSGVAKLLDGSPDIGPEIEAGLEAKPLTKGTPAYEQFLGLAQTVIDKGDPANYAARAMANHNTLSLEVVGGSSSRPDQVVPNSVAPSYPGASADTIPSPTSGSTPLARLLTGSPVNEVNSNPMSAGDYLIRYTAGAHASLLSSDASPEATKEMQINVATFLKSGGTNVTFAGTGTVKAP
jgi:pimeloyl-ACP methyl ester carboxylesterase